MSPPAQKKNNSAVINNKYKKNINVLENSKNQNNSFFLQKHFDSSNYPNTLHAEQHCCRFKNDSHEVNFNFKYVIFFF